MRQPLATKFTSSESLDLCGKRFYKAAVGAPLGARTLRSKEIARRVIRNIPNRQPL